MIDATIPDGSVLAEHPTRMTKRIKQFKPKQQLQKSEVQTLVALVKSELEGFEWSIRHYTFVAMSLKSSDKECTERFFKLADKARKARNKLSKIQRVLKRGLV